jgi:hypothetical protein
MSDHDLDERLNALAEHGRQTGRLGPAADIRRRGDRRRRNQTIATAALGGILIAALAGGVALGQYERRPSSTPPAADTATVTPTPSTSSTGVRPTRTGLPGGDRQTYIAVNGGVSNEQLLSTGKDGVVRTVPLAGNEAETERFHLAGTGPYSLRTVRLTAGEPSCLAPEDGKLVAQACDARPTSQEVTLTPAGENAGGWKLYRMSVGGFAVLVSTDGAVTAAPLRNGETGTTTFFFYDGGKYNDPLD